MPPGQVGASMSFADTILVIEDDPSIAALVAYALRQTARAVRRVGNGADAMASAREAPPELIILDLGLPDADGASVCRALRQETRAPIVVLTARHDERDAVQLLNAGADDYVTKPFRMSELIARVQAHLRRATVYATDTPRTMQLGGLTLDFARRVATRAGRDVGLTPVEWHLLRALAANAGRTLTHQQLFHAVWGNVFGDAQQNLRVHITHLRRKIEETPAAPSIIVTEPGVGYRCEVSGVSPVASASAGEVRDTARVRSG
jgi:two-component system, OmpR family, KDP operon response regulator KdpE